MSIVRYVAFLRGINVGGNQQVKMDALKKAFEKMGFLSVKTLLASGNVLFDATKVDELKLTRQIEETLKDAFGFSIPTLIRPIEELQNLSISDPYKGISVTPQTRLYVTFLSESVKSTLPIPYESLQKDFKILQVSSREVCSVLTLSGGRTTTNVMGFLEKEYGKRITTRNWNTVHRVLNYK
jgi:uncharacterized protein (DUF1697 family)